jgi:hypothetical protein
MKDDEKLQVNQGVLTPPHTAACDFANIRRPLDALQVGPPERVESDEVDQFWENTT